MNMNQTRLSFREASDTFCFVDASRGTQKNFLPVKPFAQSKLKIALIDDDPIYCLKMEKLFKKNGVLLKSFSSSKEFCESSVCGFSTVIVDFDLGDQLSGLEFAGKILKDLVKVPVIMVSSTLRECLDKKFWPGNVIDFIEKSEGLETTFKKVVGVGFGIEQGSAAALVKTQAFGQFSGSKTTIANSATSQLKK